MLMDNQDYLDQIAVKPQSSMAAQIFTPKLIKIISGAIIALVLIFVLGAIINGFGAKDKALYESYHLRLQNLSAENGPITTYAKSIKSSKLRSLAGTLRSSLFVTATNYSAITSNLKVDISAISDSAAETESANLIDYTNKLKDAKLNGLLDRSFATSTALQISEILSMESEIRNKTKDAAVLNIVDTSTENLKILYQELTDFANSN